MHHRTRDWYRRNIVNADNETNATSKLRGIQRIFAYESLRRIRFLNDLVGLLIRKAFFRLRSQRDLFRKGDSKIPRWKIDRSSTHRALRAMGRLRLCRAPWRLNLNFLNFCFNGKPRCDWVARRRHRRGNGFRTSRRGRCRNVTDGGNNVN